MNKTPILIRIFSGLLALGSFGCGSTKSQPIIVEVTEAPAQSGRYRTTERQRDVWIAPQAVDNEILQHEQIVTFVEKPGSWQIPSIIEPHTMSDPQLPLQEGEYDAAVLKRQREMIRDKEIKFARISGELEDVKRRSQEELKKKEKQVMDLEADQNKLQKDLSTALQRLKTIEDAESLKKSQEEEKRKQKSWWKIW